MEIKIPLDIDNIKLALQGYNDGNGYIMDFRYIHDKIGAYTQGVIRWGDSRIYGYGV